MLGSKRAQRNNVFSHVRVALFFSREFEWLAVEMRHLESIQFAIQRHEHNDDDLPHQSISPFPVPPGSDVEGRRNR
jgi:hypothetical protein